MTPEKILEIARRYGDHDLADVDWYFYSPDLISFAQSVIEAERESSDKPVAWVSCDGYLSHYRLGDEYIPLYRHPPPARKLTDEEINDCFDIAERSFHKHLSGIKGQQLSIQDWPNWHFARAIERRISGEE